MAMHWRERRDMVLGDAGLYEVWANGSVRVFRGLDNHPLQTRVHRLSDDHPATTRDDVIRVRDLLEDLRTGRRG